MVELVDADTILLLGSSVKRGLDSLLSELPAADYNRVFGIPLTGIGGILQTYPDGQIIYPATGVVPGVKLWTCRQPYATWNSKAITTGGGAGSTNLDYTGPTVDTEHPQHSWLFIQTAVDGHYLLRRINTHVGTDVQVFVAWGGSGLSNAGTVIFLKNSHTVDGAVANGTVITKENVVGHDFGSVDGKFVVFFTSGTRRILSHTALTITLDDPITVPDEEGFVILDGAGAGETLATMATGAVLQDMQHHLNAAPVFLTGLDYANYDQQCAVRAPTFSQATINSDIEMFNQFRSRFGGTVYGVDINRDSATISPEPIGTLLRTLMAGWQHDLRDLSFHPSTTESLWTAFRTAVLSLRSLLLADNKTMRVRAFVALIAENDQILAEGGAVRHANIGKNLVLLRDAVRELVGDPNMPFIVVGPSSENLYPFRAEVYAQIEQLVMEDTHAELVDTTDPERYQYVVDGRHLDAPSQTNLGVDIALAYDRVVDGSTMTEVDICNLALRHIGESARVTALNSDTDTSAQARHCSAIYEPALRHLLEQHSWDFATRRTELVDVTETIANTRAEWSYAYAAPRHMAGAIAILAPGSANDAPTHPFLKEADGAGRTIIYTDVQNAVIRYNRFVSNTRKFSASFARALSWLIAADLCGPIIKGPSATRQAEACLRQAERYFTKATAHDGNQRDVEFDVEAPWMPDGTSRFNRRGFSVPE